MALPDAEITNQSIGGSPGMQFGWMMQHDFAVYDLVVFDSVPNDEKLSGVIGSLDYSTRITFEILSTIAARTRVVALGFCLDQFLNEPSKIYLRRGAIAQRCGAQFVSMRDVTKAFGRAILGGPTIPLFEAEAHPDRSIANVAGFTLGRLLPEFIASTPKAYPTPDFSGNFTCVDPTEKADVAVVERKNSLLSARFVELRAGESIDVDLPGVCIGFYINRYGTRASLTLEGGGDTRVRNCWRDITDDLVEMSFEPVTDGFAFNRLSVSHKWRDGTATVRNDRELDYSVPAPRAQIGKIVFWTGRVGDGVPAAGDEAFDHLSLHKRLMAELDSNYERIDEASEADVPPHELLRTGRLVAAAQAFDRMADADPANVALLSETAAAWIKAKRLDLAEKRLRQRLALRPEDPAAYNELADILGRLRRVEEATTLLRQSLAVAPRQPVAHCQLGRLLYGARELAGALEHLQLAEVQGARIADLQLLIGQVKADLRDWGGAIIALRQFVAASPQNFRGLLQLGRAYGAAKQFDEAIETLYRALQNQPDSVIVIRDLAHVHAARGEHYVVINLLHDILKTDKADWILYRVYGRAALALKLRPLAIEAFQHALELRPGDETSSRGMRDALALSPPGRIANLSAA
jgi:tetratricopeptide (TPR) repeat protein